MIIKSVTGDEIEVVIDKATKFFNYLLVEGWIKSDSKLEDVSISMFTSHLLPTLDKNLGFDHAGVINTLGPGRGFRIAVHLDREFEFWNTSLNLKIDNTFISLKLSDLSLDRESRYQSNEISTSFYEEIKGSTGKKILDVGGRNRSKFDLSQKFPNQSFVVFDIVPGENVDVVGDAHELSYQFPEESFDFIICNSVFEHIFMPWKVVLEFNRILKLGGKAIISTHQSLGMHDMPWDFWRFSDTAWDALFNASTGFRILKRSLDYENFIIPFVIREDQLGAEGSAGFESSVVVVQKLSESKLEWPVSLKDVIATKYPENEDGNIGESIRLSRLFNSQ